MNVENEVDLQVDKGWENKADKKKDSNGNKNCAKGRKL